MGVAARDHREWQESGLNAPRVAVNISPIQLRQNDFVQAIREGVAPTCIDPEITESLAVEDIEGNIRKLKIDRSFIIAMVNDRDTMTLVSTIISLAHSLRLKVVAEGVETEEQAKMLRLLRCDEMQGHLFSRPVPKEALLALLRQDVSQQAGTPVI